MSDLPNCPKCESEYVYEDANLLICPECAHEWSKDEVAEEDNDERIVRDINGKVLKDGDTITVTKDLKIKGSSKIIKVGTKVKNIRLIDGDHELDCKITDIGAMKLRAKFSKKVE